ncbi:LCP family protein (plasmid) [Pontibacillus sp. ALD_SL1]|uniref:LCP family protein n=1 Tax=Pontibacillus sp. ALD_SL1 TaxID=2777185 RepID=UPI001A9574C9|nr:LCP family protein [Pontibacillus sp. ALD_SL1]QST02050.1 LCP family protein [Pontibacillus sp. ALD_SL1]
MERFLKIFSFLFSFILIAFIGYICLKMFVWDDFYQEREKRSDFLSNFYEDDTDAPLSEENQPVGENLQNTIYNRPFSLLLMGIDTNNVNVGRSDTMILAIVNPETKDISLLNIPRDMRTPIYGRSGSEKITHAHAYGLETAINTTEDFFQIPIDFYATINFNGFRDLIDTIGGLELDVERRIAFQDRITHQYFTLEPGPQHLDGMESLNYARYRYGPDGDYGRMRRQVQVLQAFADQTADIRNIPKLNKIIDVLGNNVKTDIDLTQLIKIMLNMHDINGENISTIPMESTPQMINGVSYVIVSDTEKSNIQNTLKNLLKERY